MAGDQDAVETQVSRDSHEATIGMKYQYQRETETGKETRQRTLLVHGMPEDANQEHRPP